MNTNKKTIELVQLAMFSAIILIMAFTPFLGYIPLFVTRITTVHIPVIIGSILLGPKKGSFLGFIFGLTSFINNTINPTATSFVFSPFYSVGDISGNFFSIIVCFVPRILVGILPYFIYKIFSKINKNKILSLTISGVIGSITNTFFVMGFIYIFFADSYAQANNITSAALYTFILGIIATNGVPEAIASGIITTAICQIIFKFNFFKNS